MNDASKKVFFLYPPSVVRENLITILLDQEFEVYVLRDVETAALAIRKYPDSILFVNIDDGMTEREWAEWIRARMANPETGAVGFGIVTYNGDETLRKKYLMDIGIGYGFIVLKLGLEESARILVTTLNAAEAKGRRKYVRANCLSDPLATVNLRDGKKLVNGKICDISVVGLSCVFDDDPKLAKNELIGDVQLKLRASLILTQIVVFGMRKDADGRTVYVFLFARSMESAAREKIRSFIQLSLQSGMELDITTAQAAGTAQASGTAQAAADTPSEAAPSAPVDEVELPPIPDSSPESP